MKYQLLGLLGYALLLAILYFFYSSNQSLKQQNTDLRQSQSETIALFDRYQAETIRYQKLAAEAEKAKQEAENETKRTKVIIENSSSDPCFVAPAPAAVSHSLRERANKINLRRTATNPE